MLRFSSNLKTIDSESTLLQQRKKAIIITDDDDDNDIDTNSDDGI